MNREKNLKLEKKKNSIWNCTVEFTKSLAISRPRERSVFGIQNFSSIYFVPGMCIPAITNVIRFVYVYFRHFTSRIDSLVDICDYREKLPFYMSRLYHRTILVTSSYLIIIIFLLHKFNPNNTSSLRHPSKIFLRY